MTQLMVLQKLRNYFKDEYPIYDWEKDIYAYYLDEMIKTFQHKANATKQRNERKKVERQARNQELANAVIEILKNEPNHQWVPLWEIAGKLQVAESKIKYICNNVLMPQGIHRQSCTIQGTPIISYSLGEFGKRGVC